MSLDPNRKEITTMETPPIVSPQEWLAARKELLVKEKELTRARDRVNADIASQQSETSGAILTPPGAGGDVHGVQGVHPDTPTPPSPDAP